MTRVTPAIVAGIFVGGRARRMGGIAKGLLPAEAGGPSIVARSATLLGTLGAEVLLVGAHPAYAALPLPTLADAADDAGPLGGLVALLAHAGSRPAIALGGDMPRVTLAMLTRLRDESSGAAALAPHDGERWSPLFARYDAPRVLPAARAHLDARVLSLQALLDVVGARPLPLDAREREALHDWDTPEDIDANLRLRTDR